MKLLPPKNSVLILLLMLAPFLAAPSVCPAGEPAAGLLVPLTGKLASAGESVRDGVVMAVAEINETGGVAGERLEIVIVDSKSTVEGASRAAGKLTATPGVRILIGGCGSSSTLAAGAVAESNEVPFLVTTAADDRITEEGLRYLFRLNAPASEHTSALESYLAGRVTRDSTAAVIFERSPFGYYGLKRFMQLQRRLGFRIVSRVIYEQEQQDFGAEVAGIIDAAPDIVYLVSRAEDGAAILREAAMAGLDAPVLLAGSRELLSAGFGEAAGGTADGLVGPAWWVPLVSYPGAGMFRENFTRRYGREPNHHNAQGYAAAWVAADAMERAVTGNAAGVRDALEDTRLMTVYGPVGFEAYDRKRRQNRPPSLAVMWQGGELRVVWPRSLP